MKNIKTFEGFNNNEQINKYLVTETIPYEGVNHRYKVMATSSEEAIAFVKADHRYLHGDINWDVTQYNIKGTKQKGVIN